MGKSCGFFGHKFLLNQSEIGQKLYLTLIHLIENENVDTFFVGEHGDFDILTANILEELKKIYPLIKIYLVISYPKQLHSGKTFCDDFIYPPILEKTPKRFCIAKRNQWVANNSDVIVAYISSDFGGAYNALTIAIKKQKKIINLS